MYSKEFINESLIEDAGIIKRFINFNKGEYMKEINLWIKNL